VDTAVSSWAEERFEVSRLTEESEVANAVKIKYGDFVFRSSAEYDEVCRAITDGRSLEVYYFDDDRCVTERITFYGDPDWVSLEL
jgi:hypothetical protein